MGRLQRDNQWYKDLETEVVEKIIAEEFEEIANRTKEEIANSWHHKHKARIHNARISRLFMFLFIYSFSKMPESKTFYFSLTQG